MRDVAGSVGVARPRWWAYMVLGLGVIAVAGPFVWMMLSSLKPEGEIRRVPPTLWPETFTLDNFGRLFGDMDFARFLTNSLVVALAVTAGNLLFCAMAGYALAKIDFAGKRLLFTIVLVAMAIPGMVVLVPMFMVTVALGLTDTYLGLVLPFIATPLGVFLMRQFIGEIPDELFDAARIDGAHEARVFSSVVLPLSRPALATLGILTFLASWNNFLWPLVVASSEKMYTMPVALALYSVGQNTTSYGLLLAGAVVVVVPVIAIFLVFQRQIIQGVATTGLK